LAARLVCGTIARHIRGAANSVSLALAPLIIRWGADTSSDMLRAVDYRVQLEATRPNFGGLRWWFICPLVRRDGGPPRRVAKLYLPSGGKYFGSREGNGLTYTSCQESGKNHVVVGALPDFVIDIESSPL
jgi:hypothetical protein